MIEPDLDIAVGDQPLVGLDGQLLASGHAAGAVLLAWACTLAPTLAFAAVGLLGSVALVLRSDDGSTHVFTGDSLFPGGVGNTQQDAARFGQLIDDVEQRLFAVLPDDTWVYPGHGKDTTLGAERPHLGEWRERGW